MNDQSRRWDRRGASAAFGLLAVAGFAFSTPSAEAAEDFLCMTTQTGAVVEVSCLDRKNASKKEVQRRVALYNDAVGDDAQITCAKKRSLGSRRLAWVCRGENSAHTDAMIQSGFNELIKRSSF